MDNYVLVKGARQLLTLHGTSQGARRGRAMSDLGIIEDGSVLIRDSEIAAVGPTRRIENLKEARNAAVIPATGRVVMPGFVDPWLDLMPGTGQPNKSVSITRTLQEATALLRSALQHGTTRAEVKVSGATAADELRYLRHARRLETGAHEVVRTWLMCPRQGDTPGELIRARQGAFEWLRKKGSPEFLELAAESGMSDMTFAFGKMATECQMGCKLIWRGAADKELVHLLTSFRFHSVGGVQQFETDALAELATLPAIYVFAGGSGLWRQNGADSVRALLDANGAVAVASGYNAMSSPVFSMQMVVAQALLQMKMTAEEAISAATINAAHACGLGSLAGSLEYAKQADLLLLNLSDYRELPRQFGINHVGMVIRAGTVVFNRIGWKAARGAS